MKLRQLTGSLIAATVLFTSTLPASANPFGNIGGGVFKRMARAKRQRADDRRQKV